MGPFGAVAVLNSDFGTGIRMAAPLAMLSSLALCANKGILVKDGRALELMNEIDTVLFDKTGTLTRERPEVGRIIAANGFDARADPPVRRRRRAEVPPPDRPGDPPQGQGAGASTCPPIDDTQYKVGYGITVHVEGHTVRVGSKRFMETGGDRAAARGPRGARRGSHLEGHTMVMVGVDGQLGGAHRAAGGRPARGPRDRRGAPRSAGSSTSRSSRATTRRRPGSWPSRWGWTATSPRSSRPTRRTTSRSSRRKGARSASSGTGSTTRSP